MYPTIRLAILDDHQAIIDGYLYRLSHNPDIEVIATIYFGEDLKPVLERWAIDILLLDLQVPTSRSNPNPYPMLNEIPHILQIYPELQIVIISMHAQPALIRVMLDAGVSGYILKEDVSAFRELAGIIRFVYAQGIYLSPGALKILEDYKQGEFLEPLSSRQVEALSLCSAYPNASTYELANKLGVKHSTFRNLMSGTYLKLNVRNRSAAVRKAEQLGLIIPLDNGPFEVD